MASGDDRVKEPTLTFADVGGLEEAKKQIRELVQANLDGEEVRPVRRAHRNGILLHGPRGTGKTFLAEAVAGEFELKYFYVVGSGPGHTSISARRKRYWKPCSGQRNRTVRPYCSLMRLTPWAQSDSNSAKRTTRVGRTRSFNSEDSSVDGVYRRCSETSRSHPHRRHKLLRWFGSSSDPGRSIRSAHSARSAKRG